jgi:hypothetical protein
MARRLDTSAAGMISEARQSAGISQAVLARRARTSQSRVSSYEAGLVQPLARTLHRLLAVCGPHRPSEALAEKRELILDACQKRGATRVEVFGSIARGEDDVESDVDLLVHFPPGTRRVPSSNGKDCSFLLGLLGLEVEIEGILGVKVDLATPALLRPHVLASATAEAVPL